MQLYPLFFAPGEVCEIRAIGVQGKNPNWAGFAKSIVSGYYDNPEEFDRGAANLDKAQARGVYFTINPVNPALIARASNRLKVPKSTTQDPDIVCIRWFPIDLDPKRPADISSTDAEVKAALDVGKEIAAWLEGELGFEKAIRAFSGNGFHLLYRLPDLPNNEETHKIVVAAMAAIKIKFDSDAVDIDPAVVNPSRIWKCYGTTGRKGDPVSDRPHRVSSLFPKQPSTLADVPITNIDMLKKLASYPGQPQQRPAAGPQQSAGRAAPPPSQPSRTATTRPMTRNELGPLDMEKYLNHFSIEYDTKDDGAKTLYRLQKCLFNPDHGPNEASIVVPRHGAILYQCFHASCKTRTWKDARREISGEKPLAEFCTGYDPNWKPPRSVGTGMMANLIIPMTDAVALKNGIGGGPPVPQPSEVDPREFYEKKGKRPVFVPFYLAKYLAAYLHPICATSGIFYHYENGLWREFTKTSIGQICVHAMREEIQAAWIDNVSKILSGLVNREESEWPDNPTMINCKNGMLDMENQELVPHDPAWGSRTQLPVSYNPAAGWSELWLKFLEEIFPDDPTKAKRYLLQQYFGYCLLRDSRFQKALFLYGTGANGKSTVLDVLTAMVGAENTSSLTLQDLAKQFRAQFLQNKLVNVSTETDTRDPLTTSTFKAVVDGSPLTTERKYGEPFQYRPFAKWIVAMNEAPVIPDKSYGFGRRVLVLNFNRRFEPTEIKERMSDLLITEIDGVFNWAVDGLYGLLTHGFKIGQQVMDDTDKLMEVLNPLLIFVSECCEIHDDIHESSARLWNAYAAWCADGKNRPLGRNKFQEQIQATFPRVKKTRKQENGAQETRFEGIRLAGPGNDYAEKGERRTNKMFE